jgi:phosphoribosylamine--glycine ligase
MAISDGVTVWPLAPSRDYKRAFDGNVGPMTGGMGAYSPVSAVDSAFTEHVMARIIRPTIEGMSAEGTPFQGILYAGLMVTRSGPRVLEFNVRFGDPETQVVLPRLESDLCVVLDAAIDGQLGSIKPLAWSREATCGVVIASDGYPGDVETGYGVVGLGDVGSSGLVFHNGTRNPVLKSDDEVMPKLARPAKGALGGRSLFGMFVPSRSTGKTADKQAVAMTRNRDGQVITSGGRVLTVVGRGRTVDDARAAAYSLSGLVGFTGSWSRSDIGADDADLGN